jgi:hypothetical protein
VLTLAFLGNERNENVNMKNKNKQINKFLRFILLPFATILYVYGIASLGIAAVILIVFAFRRDWVILDGNTPEALLSVIVGVLFFSPPESLESA